MKKAFMRGVCALNMEAMSMFKENPDSETEGHTVEPPLQERQQQQFSQQVERNGEKSLSFPKLKNEINNVSFI